jgi:hypothetical protein
MATSTTPIPVIAPRRLSKEALEEELLDPQSLTLRKRGDYGTGVEPNAGEIAVHATTDQLIAATSEPADRFGVSSVPRGGVYR